MSNADLIKRLRDAAVERAKANDLYATDLIEMQAADALEAAERRDVERVHEINKLKLIIQKLDRKR